MKRRSNAFVWTGFALTLVAFLSYYFYFLRFPSTRDFPWLNLLLFAAAGALLSVGLKRAYGDPELYRGKVGGAILGVLSLAVFVLFCVFNFVLAKNLPASNTAPRAGQHRLDRDAELAQHERLPRDGHRLIPRAAAVGGDRVRPGAGSVPAAA